MKDMPWEAFATALVLALAAGAAWRWQDTVRHRHPVSALTESGAQAQEQFPMPTFVPAGLDRPGQSLIEVVNRFGSFFYGSILGVFILAVAVPRATANGAFIGLIAGMGSVAWAAAFTKVAFLWHNVIGAVVVVIVGLAVSVVDPGRHRSSTVRQA